MKSLKFMTKFFILIFIFGCKKENKIEDSQYNLKNEMIEKIIEKQLKQGAKKYISDAGVEIPNEKFDISEFDAEVQILKKILASNNYNFNKQDEFAFKINKIFGRTIDFKSDKKYLYVNNFDKCDREFNFYPFNGIDYNGTYIIKKEGYIANFYFIPELLDYQKEYPKISEIENNLSINSIDAENNSYTKELWKEIPDLKKQREINIQIITNRNKYLFNDNKASFVWLRFNDEQFLQSLVKIFGYVEDEELNKFVLDKNLKNNEEFGKVIWNKDCLGKIKFNLNIFETIKKASKKEQEKYFETINNYLNYFGNTPNDYLDLTFSEKVEISGKLAYFTTKIVGQESNDYFKFFPVVAGEEYQKEFEKQKYYNIKDFKTIYEETKTGGTWYPGMPE